MNEHSTAELLPVGANHFTLVDVDTIDRLRLRELRLKVLVNKSRGKAYVTFRAGGMFYLHRVIMGARQGQHVDHINGDGLDNRLCNLRLATPSQNRANGGARRDCSSGLKGVSWSSTSRKWIATITMETTRYYLGVFVSKKRAGMTVDRAAKALHGEFAGLNYPNAPTRPKMPTGGFPVKSTLKRTATPRRPKLYTPSYNPT